MVVHPSATEQAFLTCAASGNLLLLQRYAFPPENVLRRPVRIDIGDKSGMTALILATRNGRESAVEYLTSIGCDMDVRDVSGLTALGHATLRGQIRSAETLIVTGGASLDIVDLSGKTCLIHAASSASAAAFLELFIGAGAALDVRDAARGWTACHWAMHRRHFSHLRTLLMAGADPNVRDHNGRTALMVGVLEYDEAAPTLPGLRALLAHGGDVTATDEGGFNAADLALVHRKLPCLALLEKAGAAVTAWRDTRTRGCAGGGGGSTAASKTA